MEEISRELGCDRELVMTHVWKRAVACFNEGDYAQAQVAYDFFETLEGMTDEEYSLACVCDKENCPCHI